MRSAQCAILALGILIGCTAPVLGQETPKTTQPTAEKAPAEQPKAEATPQPESGLTKEQSQRLERCSKIIQNNEDSDATRIAQVEELLLTGWPEATQLLVTLLKAAEQDADKCESTATIVCRAIGSIGRDKPDVLGEELVPSLLALLGSPSESLASYAGSALASYPNGDVVRLLRDLAEFADAPINQRRAAVTALTLNMDRHSAVKALVEILDADQPELTSRIVRALAKISDQDYGNDVGKWKDWWASQPESEADWLRSTVRHLLTSVDQTKLVAASQRQESQTTYKKLSGRLCDVLAANYRLVAQPEQRDELLISWFKDPAEEFRRVAASLVVEQISEGNLPSEAVRKALRERFTDESEDVRRLTFEIVGALNEPSDADAILKQLPKERDDRVREAILRALGRLGNPVAIPTLVDELKRQDISTESLVATADALRLLAGRGPLDQALVDSIVSPLKSRFAATDDGQKSVKVALLGAMASIGTPQFKPEFEANLAVDDPELLLRAIQGVAVVGNGAQLDRLGNLVSHGDVRVRQRALEALGALGGEEQFGVIVPRLSPGVETVEGPREAAWQAVLSISGRLPLASRPKVVDRLSDYPTLAVQYLQKLHESLASAKPPPAELIVVRDKLARLYDSLGRHGEALPVWRQLHAQVVQAKDPRAPAIALELLRCVLACDRTDQVTEVLASLEGAPDDIKSGVRAELTGYIDRVTTDSDPAKIKAAVAKIRPVITDKWPAVIKHIESKTSPPKPAPEAAKEEPKAEQKPAPKPEEKAEAKGDDKPAETPPKKEEKKSEPKAESKPEAKPESAPKPKSEPVAEKPAQPAAEPEKEAPDKQEPAPKQDGGDKKEAAQKTDVTPKSAAPAQNASPEKTAEPTTQPVNGQQ